MLPPEALGTILPCFSHSFWWLPAIFGLPWFVAPSNFCLCLHMAYSSMCLCPKFSPLIRTPDTGFSESENSSVVSDSLPPHGLQPARLLSPWNFPGKNTGVGSHFLLQGIFPNQGSNPGLLHCRQILHRLSHQESAGILEWVAFHFSRGSSWPRNQTGVSCIAGRCFPSWATREAWHWV